MGNSKPRKMRIFHVTPFIGRWRNGYLESGVSAINLPPRSWQTLYTERSGHQFNFRCKFIK